LQRDDYKLMICAYRLSTVLFFKVALSACGSGGGDAPVSGGPVSNRAPVVDAGTERIVDLNATPVELDGTVSDDGLPAGASLTVVWSVQSGPDGASISDTSAVDTTVDFVREGVYVLELSAHDSELQSSDTVRIVVEASAIRPVADAGGPYSGIEGSAVAVDGSGTSDPNGAIVGYSWDLDSDGNFDDASGATAVFPPASAGTYSIGLRIAFADGSSSSDATTVTVANVAPSADVQSLTTPRNTSIPILLTGSDPGNVPLAFRITSGPADGILSGTAPNVTYTPKPGFFGADSFSFMSSDGDLASEQAAISITVTQSGGPVAYWALDEGAGAAAGDSSGNGNAGTLINGPAWTAGQIEGALFFDGANDYIEVADSDSLDVTANLTIAAWIFPYSLGDDSQGRIVDKADNDGTVGYVLRLNSSNRVGLQQSGVTGGVDSAIDAIRLNAWNHVVGVVQGGTNVTLYANGVKVGTGSLARPITVNNKAMRIGMRHDGDKAFEGMIDEIRIYDQALTADRIATLYTRGADKFSINDRVHANLDADVRAGPSASETLLGKQNTGSVGTIIGGPVSSDNSVWWKVDYDTAADGWSRQAWLEKTRTASYYPPPRSAGGWRSIAGINSTPTDAQKAEILDITGVDWDLLERAWEYSQALSTGSSLLVIKDSWVIGEWGSTGQYHVASVTKSLTGLAVAKMMNMSDRGQLSQPIDLDSLAYHYLPQTFGESDPLKKQIKVKHLMTMSPGIEPVDPDLLTLDERLSLPMDAEPETEWVYSSLPPNLLSMIIQTVTGRNFGDFFNTEIAAAIGASQLTWETIDGGYTKGAAGASLSARDLARIAYLTLQGGMWDAGNGLKRIISEPRVDTITQWAPFLMETSFRVSPGSPFPLPDDAPNHYGYLWWTNRTAIALGPEVPTDAYYMHGFRDNLAIVVPSANLIVIRLADSGPSTDMTFRGQLMSLVMSSLVRSVAAN